MFVTLNNAWGGITRVQKSSVFNNIKQWTVVIILTGVYINMSCFTISNYSTATNPATGGHQLVHSQSWSQALIIGSVASGSASSALPNETCIHSGDTCGNIFWYYFRSSWNIWRVYFKNQNEQNTSILYLNTSLHWLTIMSWIGFIMLLLTGTSVYFRSPEIVHSWSNLRSSAKASYPTISLRRPEWLTFVF